MTRGRILIDGNAGMHLGAHMKGGTIEVTGNASDWIGAEMSDGLIRIRGNAGGQVGAAYRGSSFGMQNGTILIDGSAGIEVGMRMKRGTIAVRGPVRDFAGLQMKGGTIFLLGGAEIRTGAWMVRGTIVSFTEIRMLPTFSYACAYNPVFLNLYVKHLDALRFFIAQFRPRWGISPSHRRRFGSGQRRSARVAAGWRHVNGFSRFRGTAPRHKSNAWAARQEPSPSPKYERPFRTRARRWPSPGGVRCLGSALRIGRIGTTIA